MFLPRTHFSLISQPRPAGRREVVRVWIAWLLALAVLLQAVAATAVPVAGAGAARQQITMHEHHVPCLLQESLHTHSQHLSTDDAQGTAGAHSDHGPHAQDTRCLYQSMASIPLSVPLLPAASLPHRAPADSAWSFTSITLDVPLPPPTARSA